MPVMDGFGVLDFLKEKRYLGKIPVIIVSADFLNTYKRTSKLGNIKWTRSAVIALLKNERYCGDVLSRKTFTPNFLDHKAKKNKKNRTKQFTI